MPNKNDSITDSLPPQPQPVGSEKSGRLRRAAAAALLVAAGMAIGHNIGNTASADSSTVPVEIGPPQEVLERTGTTEVEAYAPFDFDKAYESSRAVLDKSGPQLALPLTHDEEISLFNIGQKMVDAQDAGLVPYSAGKGGGDAATEADYLKQFEKLLTKEEVDLYTRKRHLLFDRSMNERNTVETTLHENDADYYGSVVTSSGIRFNIYEAQTSQDEPAGQEPDKLNVDPKALDTLTQYMIHELSNLGLGNQVLLTQAEVERIQTAARAGALNNVTMNIVFADNIEDCVMSDRETLEMRQPTESEICLGLATQSASSDLQYPYTSDFRNILILMGRSSGLSASLVEGGHNLPPSMSNGNQTLLATVVHELGHGLMSVSTLTDKQRLGDPKPEGPGNDLEHKLVIEPLEQRVANEIIFNTPALRRIQAFYYTAVTTGSIKAE